MDLPIPLEAPVIIACIILVCGILQQPDLRDVLKRIVFNTPGKPGSGSINPFSLSINKNCSNF
jgi:hypothetical protein